MTCCRFSRDHAPGAISSVAISAIQNQRVRIQGEVLADAEHKRPAAGGERVGALVFLRGGQPRSYQHEYNEQEKRTAHFASPSGACVCNGTVWITSVASDF
jgi:hypothetical protein